MKALLIEDNEVFCPIIRELLEPDLTALECAYDFEEGLHFARGAKEAGNPFDFCITDLDLGKGTWDTLERLPKLLPFVNKLIVLSGYSSFEIRRQAKLMGVLAFITKGEESKNFREKVLEVIGLDPTHSIIAAASEQLRLASAHLQEACNNELAARRTHNAGTNHTR